jgi:hypothetical protein
MKSILFLLFIISAGASAAPADSAGEILGVFQFENALGDTQFTGFHQYLVENWDRS